MSAKLPLSHRCRGFSLIEVLVALALLTIAVLGVGAVVGVQSGGTAQSLSVGLGGVARAGLLSTATFLAEDRLEQVKGFLVQNYTVNGGNVTDPFAAAVAQGNAPSGFPDEPLGTIGGYPNVSRQVRVVGLGATHQVTVTVFFSAPGDNGVHTESVAVTTLMAARPT